MEDLEKQEKMTTGTKSKTEKMTPETHPEWFDPNIKTPIWEEFKKSVEKEIERLK